MLVLLGDTHGKSDHRLSGHTRSAVRTADHVCHTGDFTTETVYEAMAGAAGADTDGRTPLSAVYGNRDEDTLRSQLPETTTVDHEGIRLAVAHGHRHDRTSLGLLAREAEAAVVAVGHSHQPGIERLGDVLLVNPGSHADPRGDQPAHAEIETVQSGEKTDTSASITLLAPTGETLTEQTFRVK